MNFGIFVNFRPLRLLLDVYSTILLHLQLRYRCLGAQLGAKFRFRISGRSVNKIA